MKERAKVEEQPTEPERCPLCGAGMAIPVPSVQTPDTNERAARKKSPHAYVASLHPRVTRLSTASPGCKETHPR